MGTLGTIAICLLCGATFGAFLAAIFYYKDLNVKKISWILQDYCKDHACYDCKFGNKGKAPYCKLQGYPFVWTLDKEDSEE